MDPKVLVFYLMIAIFSRKIDASSESNVQVAVNEISELPTRLPRDVYPINYNLFLRPYMGQHTFNGNVTILFNVTKPTATIILHSKMLAISYTQLYSAEEKVPIPILNSFEYKEHEYWVSELYEEVPEGLYEISLGFESKLSKPKDTGFYQVSYNEERSAETRWIAVAELEPSEARSTFPCFDEPEFKATFKIQVQHPHDNGYFALSNMDVERVERYENFSVTTFNKSVKMSTYLVTFVVCNLQGESITVNTNGVGSPFQLTVFAEKHYKNDTDIVLHITKDAIEYLIDYYKIPFPLPKLDIIAIPGLVHPALEAWGLVLFKATTLLRKDRKAVQGYSLAHEVSHSWFGNLVTMKWWDDVWLNEGFATFIGMKVVEQIRPELEVARVWHYYVDSIFDKDCLLSTHPIIQTTQNTNAKTHLFDHITYYKSAFVIKMLEDFVGTDNFKLAVTNYLRHYSFGNADTADLVNEFRNVKNPNQLDVGIFLNAWTKQPGYPIINVDRIENDTFRLIQRRYFSNKQLQQGEVKDYNYTWPIPIWLITDGNRNPQKIFFNMEDDTIDVKLPNTKWAIFNVQKRGYYRVNYSREMWNEFAEILANDNSALDYVQRKSLWKDATELLENEQLGVDVVLELLKALSYEKSSRIWSMGYNVAKSVLNTLDEEGEYAFCNYSRQIVDRYLQENPNIFREVNEKYGGVYSFACIINHEQCIAMSRQHLQSYLAGEESSLWKKLASIVQASGMKNFPDEAVLDLWMLCQENWDGSACDTLAVVQNQTFFVDFLEYIVDGSKFDSHSIEYEVSLAARANFDLVWNTLYNKWKEINTRNPKLLLESMLENLLPYFVDEHTLPEVKDLLETYYQYEREVQERLYFQIENAIKSNTRRNENVIMFLRKNFLI